MRNARPLAATLLALSLTAVLPQTAGAAPATALNRFAGISADRHALILQGPDRKTGPAVVVHDADIIDADLSPDGHGVYYLTRSGAGGRIYHTPFAGGPSRLLAEGDAFAVSPDGQQLAYSYDPDPARPGTDERIAILDLHDRSEFWFAGPFPNHYGSPAIGVEDIAFSPDSARLAFTTTEGVVWSFDPMRQQDLGGASSLFTAAGKVPVSDPVWMADGRIAVLNNDGSSVKALNLETGEGKLLLDLPRFRADGLDVDASGQHLLLSVQNFSGDSRGFVTVPWADREGPRPGGGQECDWATAAW